MRKIKPVALFVGLFFLVLANAFAGEPQVTIKTSGRFFGALIGHSANIRFVVKIIKHEGNRDLEVNCDGNSDSMYVSSGKSLDGDKEEQETFDFAFNLLPGTYRCSAVLTRMAGGKTKDFTSFVEVEVQ